MYDNKIRNNTQIATSLFSNILNSIIKKFPLTLLLLTHSCNNNRWINITPITISGTKKCNEKNRPNVASQIVNLAQIFISTNSPFGNTLSRLVITVAPHNDILPHGNT